MPVRQIVALDGATFQMSACARMLHSARQNDKRLRRNCRDGEHERIGTSLLKECVGMLLSSRQLCNIVKRAVFGYLVGVLLAGRLFS